MPLLDSRKEDILGFVVRDFVRTAFPVSSNAVFGGLRLEVSPATIRNIMLELDDMGYLYQPHTSAGRAPTEKGYRYFTLHLMSVKQPEVEMRTRLDKIVENMERETDSAFEELSRALSSHLKLFSGIGLLDEDEKIFGKGLSEVFRAPEFAEPNLAAEFADFAENIEENLLDLNRRGVTEHDLEPTFHVSGFGMASVFFDDAEFGRCAVFSAGPKRMNYEKSASVLKYTAKDIKSKNKKNARRRNN